jgi:EipB-like
MRISAVLASAIVASALAAAAIPARAAGVKVSTAEIAAHLAGHQAQYQLTLDETRGGDVVASRGTMSYQVADACDAWATNQRLQMTLTNRDGQDIEMVSDYATWESKDGKRIRFHMRQTTEGAVTEEDAGEATLDSVGGEGSVHYTAPQDKTIPLPAGTLFPMFHTAHIIAAAENGEKFVTVPLFDGTGPKGAQNSSIVILNWDKPEPAAFPALSALPSGRMRIAFFDRGKDTVQPDYEVGMRYWENGIADNLKMDFGDFVMNGKLRELDVPRPHC